MQNVELVSIGWKLALMFVLAFLAETLTEYFARPFVKLAEAEAQGRADVAAGTIFRERQRIIPDWVLRYIAALVGVGLALGYRADILGLMGLPPVYPAIGYIVTGLIIGRGANYLNDIVKRWLSPVVEDNTP